jgi:5-methylcytosine-specific restriction protein A
MLTYIKHAVALVKSAVRPTTRSPEWHKVMEAHLKDHPACAACGGSERLNVHHMKPFHLDPSLELDPKNLITLCMGIEKHCHLLVGHGDDFKAFNPDVAEDAPAVLAAYYNKDATKVASIEAAAKAKRKFEL